MAYDATAKAVGIKAIGTVESSFDYTAINYADPITVGVMQWFGTRASALLRRMRGQQAVMVSERTNFCQDPGTARADYWASTAATQTATVGGSATPYVQIRHTATGALVLRVGPTEKFPVREGDTISFSARVSTQVDADIQVWFVAENGAVSNGASRGPVVSMKAADPYATVTHSVKVAGNGTMLCLIRTVDTVGQNATFRVNSPIITINKPVLPFFSGATTSTATNKYAWLGAAGASYSTETVYGSAGGQWTGVAQSINDALDQHNDNDNWWTDRFLTRAEGESLRPMLNANKAIQNAQAIEDMESYKKSAVSLGIDPEGNTKMMLLFFTALHQSPARARRLIATIGPSSSFQRLHEALLSEEVFGRYKTRYNTAYSIIDAMDPSGVDTTPPPTTEPVDPGNGPDTTPEPPTGGVQPVGDVRRVTMVGDNLHIRTKTGLNVARLMPQGEWMVGGKAAGTTPVTPLPPEPAPEVPLPPEGGSGPSQGDLEALVRFMTDRIGKYAYSQGGTRMEPDRNNYTDCSGLVRYAYQKVFGIEVGTYTVEQLGRGTRILQGSGSIDETKLRIGDLILYNWSGGRSSVDHVEMYIGNSQVCGHGGPGNGPTTKTLQGMATKALDWYVNRYV